MTSGRNHDRITLFASPVVLAVASQLINPAIGCTVAAGFLVGGLLLSPDLDTKSRPWKRWGVLKGFWVPYMNAIPHRSPLSHGIVIGTLGRVLYLLSPLIVAALFSGSLPLILAFVSLHFWQCLAVLIGLELGAIAHLIADGMLFG